MELTIHGGQVDVVRNIDYDIVASWNCPHGDFLYEEIIGKVTADAVVAELKPHAETHLIEAHNWDPRRQR